MKIPPRFLHLLSALLIGGMASALCASCSKKKEQAPAAESKKPGEVTAPMEKTSAGDGTPETSASAPASSQTVAADLPAGEESKPSGDASPQGSGADSAPADATKHVPDVEGDADRIAALRELVASGSDSLASTIESALEGDSEAVRIEAIRSAEGLEAAQASEILGSAAREGSPEVAAAAIEVARGQTEEVRMAVLRNGLASEDAGTRQTAVMEFAQARPKYRIDYIFQSIEDTDPGVSAAAADVLEGIFGERFESAAEADAWWAGNASLYDAKLNPVEPSPK